MSDEQARQEAEVAREPTAAETTGEVAPREPTVPIAGDGEASVTGVNMGLYSLGAVPKLEGEPVDYNAVAEAAAEHIVSDIPVMMSDADALIVGRTLEARYVPPPAPPSVIEQLNAMKEAAGAPPAEGGEGAGALLDPSALGQRRAYGAAPPITPQRDVPGIDGQRPAQYPADAPTNDPPRPAL